MITWWESLTWSHAAFWLCIFVLFIGTVVAALHAGDPDHDIRIDREPSDACKRTSYREFQDYK
jgi:hypothetical protein